MAEPTRLVREAVYNRDGHTCPSCGRHHDLTFQHRRATGMGGSKLFLGYEEGLTACVICNAGFEHTMQTRALLLGWKVARWAIAAAVPVYYGFPAGGFMPGWYRLEDDQRYGISESQALRMMRDVYGELYDAWKERLT